jgi:hypothetical protein
MVREDPRVRRNASMNAGSRALRRPVSAAEPLARLDAVLAELRALTDADLEKLSEDEQLECSIKCARTRTSPPRCSTRANLHPPTRRWHLRRTLGGWRLERHGRAVIWISRLGRRYRVDPHDYRLGP